MMAGDCCSRYISGVLVIVALACLAAISGCASLGKEECLNADWRTIGYEDGARGQQASRIGSHRKACAKYGVKPDFDLYENGRRQGLREYCTPRNGYYLGVRGGRYNGVCPKDLEGAYRAALGRGRKVYALNSEIKQKKTELKKIHSQLDTIELDLTETENELVRKGVSPQRRRQLLEEIRTLEDDQEAAIAEISEREQILEDLRINLSLIKTQNPYK